MIYFKNVCTKLVVFFYAMIYSASIMLIFLYLIKIPGSKFFSVIYQWKEILILPLMLFVTEMIEDGNYRAVNEYNNRSCFLALC